MMRSMSKLILVLAAMLLGAGPASADNRPAPRPRILFVGLWDRAFQPMAEASEATGVPVEMGKTVHAETPEEVAAELTDTDYTRFDLIYVLQIDQMAAHALVEPLKEAKARKPSLAIVQLDRRETQQELIDQGLLQVDPQVRAYWRGFGPENLKRLLIYSRVKYLGEPGEVLEPVPVPSSGLYHPDATGVFDSWTRYSAWYGGRTGYRENDPLVAIIIQQDYVVYGNTRVYDALARSLESRSIGVVMMFGAMQDLQGLVRECRPALLILQHHSGPEDNPEDGRKPFLEELGVPYMYAAGMMSGITVKQWQSDLRGTRMGGYGQLARHELYGIIEPFLIGAKGDSAYGFALDEPIPDRVDRVAGRVKGWLQLRATPVSDKKIAIVYFHKYLGKADVGRPAPEMSRYLDPHQSLLHLLQAMSKAGYRVGPLPASSDDLLALMKTGGRNIPSWAPGEMAELLAQGDPILLPEEKYNQWYAQKLSSTARAAVEKVHGPPLGKFMVTEKNGVRHIVLPCIRLGNVVLAPQPDRGSLQDRDLVHSREAPPPHNYLAFYWWLQEEFGAHAIVHFGTHGSDFYLPGKELFLSGDCFPDVIMGAMPNFYVWTIQNIGEAVIAKRRSYAVIVDHGVPPILAASRDAQIDSLLELLDRYASTTAPPVKTAVGQELTAALRASPFPTELNLTIKENETLTNEQVEAVSNYLRHLSGNNVVQGMHVLGVPPAPESALPFVMHIVSRNTDLSKKLKDAAPGADADEKSRVLFEELLMKGASPADAAKRAGLAEQFVSETLAPEIALARRVWDGLGRTGDEIAHLLAGLEGKYVPPGPGGDPILRPDSLPTGRNLYGLAPQEIPTRQAWELARRLTDEFLANFRKEHGRYPEKLAFSMTGMETFRNMGVMEAQVLYLLGVAPEWSPGRLVSGLRVIPRQELGRPRVDVVMSVNGIYLKDFAPCVRILDQAVRMAIADEEPGNLVRQHTATIENELRGAGVSLERAHELACARVIGSEPGGGGARLVWFLPRSGTWQERSEINELWRTMRTHVYTGKLWGARLPELHDKIYAGTEGVISNWSDNLLSPLTNHHYPEEAGGLAMSVQWITGKKPDVSVFDLRRRENAGAIGLEEVLSLELRSVALNKEWIRGQMVHGYIGATQFMQIVDNSFQWEAVRQGAIWPGAWDKITDVYVRDSLGLGLREWFDKANPFAFQELTATLLEASRKGYWAADPTTVRQLATAHAESVARFGHGAGPYAGGNLKLRGYLSDALNRPEDEGLRTAYLTKVNDAEKVPEGPRVTQSRPAEEPSLTAGTEAPAVHADKPAASGEAMASEARKSLGRTVYLGVGLVAVLLLIGYRSRLGTSKGP